jgi:hypothetical protein
MDQVTLEKTVAIDLLATLTRSINADEANLELMGPAETIKGFRTADPDRVFEGSSCIIHFSKVPTLGD